MGGQYVLENRLGQVVRTFHWEAEQLSLVYLEDTRRIQAFESVDELKDQEIDFVELATFSPQEVKKKAIKIGKVGTLRWVEEIKSFSPSVVIPEENDDNFKTALKWTAGAQVAILLLLMLIGHFVSVDKQEKVEPQIVNIVPRPQEKQKVVEAVQHKLPKRHVVAHKIAPKETTHKIAQTRHHAPTKSQVAVNNVGALAVLGSLDKSSQTGGLKLTNMKTSRGVGLGGTQGSGGTQTSIYGSGLIAAPLGPQAKAEGAGGYGTHGKGGGEAGYGKMTMVGSSNAFFEPVEREASVEGGLDREEIAAVIQRHLGQVRFCYEQGLQVKSGLNGRVAVKFFIAANGYVSTANVSNTSLHANDVEGCIISRLKSWKFPEPRGGVIVKVTYPFVLKRVSQS